MRQRWFIPFFVVPVLAFASAGCITGGAEVFIADAIVQGTTPPDLVTVRFKYDVRDTKMRIKGHIRDPQGVSTNALVTGQPGVFIKLEGVIAPFKQGPDTNCMGAVVHYIAEDPNHEYDGDIVDMNNNPLLPNEGQLFIDACDANHDNDMDMGDTFEAQVLDGPFTGWSQAGMVVKGNFECQSPDPCSAPI